MASTSASSIVKSFKYDVFLSFRGEDTRKNFVDHLYVALVNKGITTYKDDERIEKGERISDQLIASIEDSRFYIIVFSKNYASSSWCLDELAKIMECQRTTEQTAYPVFYDVEPTEVRNQSGAVGKAFAKHVEKEDAGRWRGALKEAASLAGWELKNTFDGHEGKLIQKIVQDISLKSHFINSYVDGKLVGMETRVKDIVSSLEIGIEDVRMIGIKGMGGGGKTTLATAVFHHISDWFDGASFVENVREVSKSSLSGLKELQKQTLSDVSNDQNIVVKHVSEGKNMIRKMMGSRKVLVVLDDVDHIEQLEALAGEPNWFKPGSRIIITTRDEQVLIAHGLKYIHDVNMLSHDEAICLFSRHAFGREIPVQRYVELSEKVVHYAAGLPLTIKVLGSFLNGRSTSEWEDAIERLKTIPLKETLEKLEISYNSLETDYKEIFLEVACILKGQPKDVAMRILESCGFHAQIGLRVLEQRSLITISYILQLHDHIEEMGMNIVRRLNPNDPNKLSRLWIKEEIEDILVNDLGTEATKSIILQDTSLHPATIMKGLRNMKELRSLYVGCPCMSSDPESNTDVFSKYLVDAYEVSLYLPDALRSLYWVGYPFRCLPITFKPNNLVNLVIKWSNISQLCERGGEKVLNKLRFLDLKHSNLSTFDLGMAPNLERLDLEQCKDFVELSMPHECPKLKFLNMSGTKVSNLNLGLTPHLEWLELEGCYFLQEIHAPMGCLKKLVYLNLSGCLRFEDFSFSRGPITKLKMIAESLDTCPLHPNNTLPKIQFKCLYNEVFPSSCANVEKLLSFGLCACTNLESFSATICSLQHLRMLTLEVSIPEAPRDFGRLECLETLSLSNKEIKHLPDSICMLKHLKSLKLKSCWRLEQLPKDIGTLVCLQILYLTDCISLRDIPNSICEMKCLERLLLQYCILVKKLPDELGRLESLKELDLEGAGISHLPCTIARLKGLCIVGSRWRLESYGFTSFHPVVFKSGYAAICYV